MLFVENPKQTPSVLAAISHLWAFVQDNCRSERTVLHLTVCFRTVIYFALKTLCPFTLLCTITILDFTAATD
ncbi:MAG: hypothetical protein JNL70_06455 [Saprospiraceae bacterium]|nr:hypothetical protein [Saprospiraceae bacterium]